MIMSGAHQPQATSTFNEVYNRLANAWSDHQDLRRGGAPLPELSLSAALVDDARAAMWEWWQDNRIHGVL
jgi:hypothetical protein